MKGGRGAMRNSENERAFLVERRRKNVYERKREEETVYETHAGGGGVTMTKYHTHQ